MANYDGRIRIYPASELSAEDMAELMRVSIAFDGCLRGCRLSITDGGVLHITGGRIVIKGRLGNFNSGDIDPPTISSGSATCYVCAVCDLSGQTSSPFYIGVFTASQYSALQTGDTVSDINFNHSTGYKFITLATVTVSMAGKFSNLVTNSDYYPYMTNKQYVDDAVSALSTTLSNADLIHDDWISYLRKRVFDDVRLATFNITRPGTTIAAGSTATISGNIAYGTVYTQRDAGGNVDVYTPTVPSFVQTYTARGVPSNVDTEHWTPKGIVAINVSNCEFKVNGTAIGKNSTWCLIQKYAFGTGTWNVTLRNVGTQPAIVDVTVKVLYARAQ